MLFYDINDKNNNNLEVFMCAQADDVTIASLCCHYSYTHILLEKEISLPEQVQLKLT